MSSNIRQNEHLLATTAYIKQYFENEGSGHDWWHILRVKNLALKLSEKEGGDLFIIEMAALMHDLDDWKLVSDNDVSKTKKWLNKINLPESELNKIIEIIDQVSFKGAEVKTAATSIEAQIVQDADRLDAIGAVGIAD